MRLAERIEAIKQELDEEGIVTAVNPHWIALCEAYGCVVDLFTGEVVGKASNIRAFIREGAQVPVRVKTER